MLTADFNRLTLSDLSLDSTSGDQHLSFVSSPQISASSVPWTVVQPPQPQEFKENSIVAGLRAQSRLKEYDYASV